MNIRKLQLRNSGFEKNKKIIKDTLAKLNSHCYNLINNKTGNYNDNIKSTSVFLNNYSNIHDINISKKLYAVDFKFKFKSFIDTSNTEYIITIDRPLNSAYYTGMTLNEAANISPNIFEALHMSESDRRRMTEEATREFNRIAAEHQDDMRPY